MKRRDLLGLGALTAVPFVRASSVPPDHWDDSTDVLVAGAGAAGLCAAVAAADEGASVLIAEKMPKIGGDTLISGGKFNAVDPKRQLPLGIEDSVEQFAAQILSSGGGRNTPSMAMTLARESTVTLAWLEKLGLEFLPTVTEVFGSGFPRSHSALLPRGTGYIRVLSEAAYNRGIRIRVNSSVKALIANNDGRIIGARIIGSKGLMNIAAKKGVIVASGGFGASRRMRAVYTPQVAELPFDSHPGATGEVLEAAQSVGADLVNMEFAECVPGAAAAFDYQIRLDYIPNLFIIVNAEGHRFVDETSGRRKIAEAVLEEMKKGPCFSIASDRSLRHFDRISVKNLYRGLFAHQAWKAPSAAELGRMIGIPSSVLEDEIRRAASERELAQPPYWATRLFMRVHHTLGGIAIDTSARALDVNAKPIPGLFAAGEATGNVHGVERIGGNGLPSACTFGRIAGETVCN